VIDSNDNAINQDRPLLQDLVPEVPSIRDQQNDAFGQCWDAFWGEDPVDIVMLEAPTGVGKSIIGLGIARYATSLGMTSFMVTPQRVLQDQLGVWPGNKVMKGRGSYDCALIPSATAATAPCVKNGSVRNNHVECGDSSCPYFKALSEAKESNVVVHNYASLIAQARIGRHFGQRHILILDEGHTAVDWIRNYATIEIRRDDLATLTTKDPPDNPRWFMPWFRAVLGGLTSIPEGCPDRLVNSIIRITSDRRVYGVPDEEQYANLQHEHHGSDTNQSFFDWLVNKLDEDGTALVPWHVDFIESRGRFQPSDEWKCIPIKVAPLASMLLGLGVKVLIMSATLLDAKLILMELGLSKKDHRFIEIDSAFPIENRPIIVDSIGSMSWKTRRTTTPKIINKILKIANDLHPNEPGIIHTYSHILARDISEGLRQSAAMSASRNIVQLPRGSDRDVVIQDFLSGKFGPNAILIGPGLLEGVDGKDDSLRWQVFAKAPWPSMKDPVVMHLTKNPNPAIRSWGDKWYSWKACQSFVQGCGRPVRTPTDRGVTYVLDSSFSRILKSRFIPQYVKDAIR